MPIRSDPLDELSIPDDTTVEEHDLVTDGDVIVGGQSDVEFGVRGNNVVAGERVTFGGHIEAEGDCRIDMWGAVAEDVLVGEDAYLGERVSIGGELKVAGNLDIGDDVDIDEGFEANGWITIRNPMPTIVFLVIYLSQLLRIGEEEAAEQLATELIDASEDAKRPVVIPRGAHVSDETWRVSTPASVGDGCRLHGNVRAERVDVGSDTVVFGSLRARGDIDVGAGTEVKGDVTTRSGDVRVDRDAHVWGDISAEDVRLHEQAVVEGRIRVSGELTQLRDPLGPEPPTGSQQPTDTGSRVSDTAGSDDATGSDASEAEESETPDGESESGGTTAGERGSDSEDDTPEREASAALDGVVPRVDPAGAEHAENGHEETDVLSVDESQ